MRTDDVIPSPARPGLAPTCARCGAPLTRSSRRRTPICRVCAAHQAQAFLRNALTNRRRHPLPLDG
jgi:hypothetical protein